MISLITANIGGLHSLDELRTLISAIKMHNPDVVILQEVIITDGKNALDTLQDELHFPHSEFTFKHDFSKDYGKGVLQEKSVIEGLGMLSKLAFQSERKDLPIIKGKDRWPRLAVKYSFDGFSVCNLHNSKLEESRAIAVPKLPDADIYAGDFNMQPDELARHFNKKSSFTFKRYISFPSKNLTLDYVLLSKGEFQDLQVIEGVSDHNALFVKIDLD
ncbi:MAG: endonuclease/exonuclease/phosphatase family protein [archaeon]